MLETSAPTRARHATYYRSLAAQIGPGLSGPDETEWLEVYNTELENLRNAVDWFVQQDDADAALGLVFAMYPLLLFDSSQSIFDLVMLAGSAPSSRHHALGPSAQVVAAEKLVQAGDLEAGRAAIASAFASQAAMHTAPHPTMLLSAVPRRLDPRRCRGRPSIRRNVARTRGREKRRDALPVGAQRMGRDADLPGRTRVRHRGDARSPG